MASSPHRAIAGIALFGWANGTLAAGAARLNDRLDLTATVTALHLALFAVGLIAAGAIPPQKIPGRHVAPIIFALALAPFVGAPHPIISLTAATIIGAAGSITLADAQATITQDDNIDAQRTLVIANIGAAITAAIAAALVAVLPITSAAAAALPPIALGLWASAARRTNAPAAPTIKAPTKMRPTHQEVAALTLVGLVVAVEFSLGNQIVSYLDNTNPAATRSTTAPTILFIGLALGRTIAAVASSRPPKQTLLAALALLAIAMTAIQLSETETTRLTLVLVVGAAIGPLYPLAIASTLNLARDPKTTSSQSTAAIGIALIATPAIVGTISDTISATASLNFVIALVACCAIIASTTLASRPPKTDTPLRPPAP